MNLEKVMLKTKIVMASCCLLMAVAATPAAANWFSNPYLGINRNIGSAPNPTAEQIRQDRLLYPYGVPVVASTYTGFSAAYYELLWNSKAAEAIAQQEAWRLAAASNGSFATF
jgi:hypothetical protein